MKEKLRSFEFWVSVFSAILVVLQTLSTQINIPHTTEIMTAFLSALCVVGILKKTPSSGEEKADEDKSDSDEDKPSEDERSQDGENK